MEHRTYHYHHSSHVTRPRQTIGNIKGLELEISDWDCGNYLDEMIEDNILTAPCNENVEKEYCIAIEDDGSVYKELIFKACCNNTLLKGVKKVSERLNGKVYNGHGTSCHIHINNAYLNHIGVNDVDIIKSAEFLAPVLYKISGRSISSVDDWARSRIQRRIDIENIDLLRRSKIVDEIEDSDYERYRIVNTRPEKTTEIRIFSNYYNFDYDYIKMYIETVDFIIELAEYMQNKSYEEEYDNIIEKCKNFFGKRKYKKITNKHDISIFFKSEKERKLLTLQEMRDYIVHRFDISFNLSGDIPSEIYRQMEVLRIIRDFSNKYTLNNIKIKLNKSIDENTVLENILRNIDNEIEQINNL